jgi:hypothetical protein
MALRDTAETMIKSGRGGDFAEPVSRAAVHALLETAKRLRADNAVVAALTVGAQVNWNEILMIANVIYKT